MLFDLQTNIYNMRSLFFLILIIFNLNAALADNLVEPRDTKIPTAWVWEIKTSERTIYLLGELHSFVGMRFDELDFKLGKSIYQKTISTYTEQENFSANSPYFVKKLSEHLGLKIWNDLSILINEKFLSKIIATAEIPAIQKQLMNEFDNSTIPNAEYNIRKSAAAVNAFKAKTKPDAKKGLMHQLFYIDKKSTFKKLIDLEDSYASDASWYSACNTNELAQEIIKLAMSEFDASATASIDKAMSLQKIFANKNTILDEIYTYWLDIYPESKILAKCNVIPRNKMWFKTLEKVMHERGDPIAVVVGLMHVAGEEGLLEMFKKNGATSIRRIYSLEN
jgi:TraB/PrgY/gumN family